jgi:biopolymer transport protein ExbB
MDQLWKGERMLNTNRLLVALFFPLAVVLASIAINSTNAVAQNPQPPAGVDAAAPDAPRADAAPKSAPTKSRFWWVIQSSGLIGALILGLSIYFVATVVRLFIELRPEVAMPAEEVAQCEELLQARNYQGLYDFASKCQSFYGRLVAVGIAELPSGLAEAREVMDRNADAETVDMERKISMLAVLGTLGPMIGLVGTLQGMIESFGVIALSDQQLKASEVAGGISRALILTFEGVSLSVPAIYFFAVFKNRVAKISVDTLLAADELVRRIVQQAKSKGATPAAVEPPVPARV